MEAGAQRTMPEMLWEWDGCVVILNGFQISHDVELHDRDELFLIRKGQMPEESELAAMMSARHTPYVYDRVRQGRVAIAGLGGNRVQCRCHVGAHRSWTSVAGGLRRCRA